jgi:RNA 2',3'-cyclic 3'-phosphodiesterase
MRAFVAVEVARPGDRGAGSAPEHLTLRFLGEVTPPQLEAIVPRLQEVARRVRPFRLVLAGVGAFPDPRRPRVVWTGVSVGRTELVELARQVREALEPIVGAESQPFTPHLTLFRVRSPADQTAAVELLGGARPPPAPREAEIQAFVLKESVLGRGGAVHRTLVSFPLAPA